MQSSCSLCLDSEGFHLFEWLLTSCHHCFNDFQFRITIRVSIASDNIRFPQNTKERWEKLFTVVVLIYFFSVFFYTNNFRHFEKVTEQVSEFIYLGRLFWENKTHKYLTNQLHGLRNPNVQYRIHKVSNNPYPQPIQTQFLLIPISLRSILILSSHQRLGLPKGLFPVGLPVKIVKALLLSSTLVTWPAHINLVD